MEPVVGIISTIHGDELNGSVVIDKILDLNIKNGSVVCIPMINKTRTRRHDGIDLNRTFNLPVNYQPDITRELLERIQDFDYLIDLHTASTGKSNSYYIRTDLRCPECEEFAFLMKPQIIAHKVTPKGSVRSASLKFGIPAITVEIGSPNKIQPEYVNAACFGIGNILKELGMISKNPFKRTKLNSKTPIVCMETFWMHKTNSYNEDVVVYPKLAEIVEQDDLIASSKENSYYSPVDGVIIGKVDKDNSNTDSIIHFGIS